MVNHDLPDGWEEYATDRQREVITAWIETGSQSKAAAQLGIAPQQINKKRSAILKKMRLAGANKAELAAGIAKPPFLMKGTSTLVNRDGEAVLTWYKTRVDEQQRLDKFRQAFLEAIEDMPQAQPSAAPDLDYSDCLSLYPIADLHLGAEANEQETNDHTDTETAIGDLRRVIDEAVAAAPASKVGLIAQLGDFFDADNASNRTSRSGNQCHGSTNREGLMRVGCFGLIYAIEAAKTKHEKIVVICKPGNHDDETALALGIMLEFRYALDNRVNIVTDGRYLSHYEFGQNLLVFAHGHGAKANDAPIMAAQDFRQEWGRTTYTAIHTGHLHHMRLEEIFGVPVETHSALGKPSKYAHERFRSGRYFQRIDYCAEHGERFRWRMAL